MKQQTKIAPSPETAQLVAVDRAVAELRRGGMLLVQGMTGTALVRTAEDVDHAQLALFTHLAGQAPLLAVTGRRARVLGLGPHGTPPAVLTLAHPDGWTPELIQTIADPSRNCPTVQAKSLVCADPGGHNGIAAAIALAKLARLLPALLIAPLPDPTIPDPQLMVISAQAILDYQPNAAHALRIVAQARVPLADAENARIVAFRPLDGGIEHLAIVIGEPDVSQPVLARLHSECFTGDLLGSLRCDCGDQLRGAIAEIAQAGSGILLYLAQEGRGIGLVNKLRAYGLQDQGFDTLDANLQLGFDDDERIYQPAARMLGLLGVSQVRLLTNNPAKTGALSLYGINVVERVAHIFPSNGHNEGYLRTKATRSGHIF